MIIRFSYFHQHIRWKEAFLLLVLAQIAEYILSINSESFTVISIN